MCVGLINNLYIWFMEKINLKGYIIAKSRKGEKTQYMCTTQCFVDDIYEAKIYENKEDAERDMGVANFNYDIYTWTLHEPKYNFNLIAI